MGIYSSRDITCTGLGDLTITQLWEMLATRVIREDNIGTISTFPSGGEIRSYHCNVGTTALSAITNADRTQLTVENDEWRLELTKIGDRISVYIPLGVDLFTEVARQ